MPLLLELFCGTKTVGKIAEKRVYTVISLDNRPKTDPTICVDLLEWKYIDIPTPDFIWASPPCTTFSIAAHGLHRNKNNMAGFSEAARMGLLILQKTLEIIRYFEGKNKNMQWCFENPRGFMRHTVDVVDIHRETCCYCKYGHPFKKPTDIFLIFH
jgi:site-specific DNA-cytosine methylase